MAMGTKAARQSRLQHPWGSEPAGGFLEPGKVGCEWEGQCWCQVLTAHEQPGDSLSPPWFPSQFLFLTLKCLSRKPQAQPKDAIFLQVKLGFSHRNTKKVAQRQDSHKSARNRGQK